MPDLTTESIRAPGGVLVPIDTNDARKDFLQKPGYTRRAGKRLTWMDKRDLEMGYGSVLKLHREGDTYQQISKKLRLAVYMVKNIVQDYMACSHYPSTPDVLRLRVSGKSITQVAVHYGLTTDEVREILDGELRQMEGPVGQMAIEVARAERMFELLGPAMDRGELPAIQMAVRVAEHKMAVIQTQIETTRDIAKSKTTLTDILNELDAEVVARKPALQQDGVSREEARHVKEVRIQEPDDGGGAATSVEDC